MFNRKSNCPFQAGKALDKQELRVIGYTSSTDSEPSSENLPFVPDRPEVPLERTKIDEFLREELATPTLDKLYPHLWMAASKGHEHIEPLHMHQLRGREISACEQARLHLIWVAKRIYVKPIPRCLLNYHFWTNFLQATADAHIVGNNTPDASDREIALGFMRSYALLIKSPIDLKIALDKGLVPEGITWINWSEFIQGFSGIQDAEVAKRYHYGQIRMSRLHWLKRIFGGAKDAKPPDRTTRWFYEVPMWSQRQYITTAFGPLLFVFATLSLVLEAMQVMLSTQDQNGDSLGGDLVFDQVQIIQRAFFVFSVIVELVIGLCWACLLVIPTAVFIWQMQFGFRNRKRRYH